MKPFRNSRTVLLLIGIVVALLVPIPLLDAQRYAAYSAGLQALGVLAALILAGMALTSDRHNKKGGPRSIAPFGTS